MEEFQVLRGKLRERAAGERPAGLRSFCPCVAICLGTELAALREEALRRATWRVQLLHRSSGSYSHCRSLQSRCSG